MANCKESEKVKPTGKSVLLFSGGMDSVMFAKLLNPDVLLYIPMQSAYDAVERRRIEDMKNLKAVDAVDPEKLVLLFDVLNFKAFERSDYIIPNRNAHLILMASLYGEKIYLGSVQGDRSKDKDETFYSLMQNLLDHMHSEQHWTHERKFQILDPYKSYTKTELVKMFLEKGGKAQDLLFSYSCYSGADKPCGHCKPCVRKFVALVNNGILGRLGGKAYFMTDPLEAEWVHELLPVMECGEYRGKEDADFLKVYNG